MALPAAGKPIDINYNEAKIDRAHGVIATASKHIAATQKFIAFASRAEQQTEMGEITDTPRRMSAPLDHHDPARQEGDQLSRQFEELVPAQWPAVRRTRSR